ncbi:MAG: pyridoxal-phosphate dependent enzyme, partial [Anaerolineales bacterium]|nr:pyridoxal-phosphate dependent enzyme [Anaerolineales bacterium]
MNKSYLSGLTCSDCGRSFSINQVHTFCPDCQATLISNYDMNAARKEVDRDEIHTRPKGMWRWHEMLPVQDPEYIVSLGEGDTSLLRIPRVGKELGLADLWVKDESSNPTGSFKARGLCTAVSRAKELGLKKLIIPSAGNAGGAMATYAARAGLQALIYMPKDTPSANIQESRIAGAQVILVEGLISDAAGMA